MAAVVGAAVEDADHVRVLEAGRRRRLAAKPLHELLVLGEALVQELQRHAAVEHRVLGAPDVRHAAGAQAPQQPVAPGDQRLRLELHRFSRLSITWVAIGPATSPPKQPWQRSIVAATATCGIVGRREADEPGLVDALRRVADLGRSGLARERHPVDRQSGRGSLLGDVGHHLGQLGGGLLADHRSTARAGSSSFVTAPVGVGDLLQEGRLHQHAAVRDRRRDLGHLQRRRQSWPSAPPWPIATRPTSKRVAVTRVAVRVVDAARRHLVVGIVELAGRCRSRTASCTRPSSRCPASRRPGPSRC